MSKIIGYLKNLKGEYFAKDKDGNLREIEAGDELVEGERVVNLSGVDIPNAVKDTKEDEVEQSEAETSQEAGSIIGYFKGFDGDYFAKDSIGKLRELDSGDAVYKGESVVDSNGDSVYDALKSSSGEEVDHSGAEADVEAGSIIGYFKDMQGEYFVQEESGKMRPIHAGEPVKEGEVVVDSSYIPVRDGVLSIESVEANSNNGTIGYLKDLDGEFYAKDKVGNLRPIEAGDPVVEGEVVVNGSQGEVEDPLFVPKRDIIDNSMAEENVEAPLSNNGRVERADSTFVLDDFPRTSNGTTDRSLFGRGVVVEFGNAGQGVPTPNAPTYPNEVEGTPAEESATIPTVTVPVVPPLTPTILVPVVPPQAVEITPNEIPPVGSIPPLVEGTPPVGFTPPLGVPPITGETPPVGSVPNKFVPPIPVTPPIAEDTPPTDDGIPPIAEDTPPADDGIPPIAEDTPPTGDGTPPIAEDTPPTDDGTPPIAEDTPPTGDGTPPIDNDNEENPPAQEGGTPIVEVGIPNTTPNDDTPPTISIDDITVNEDAGTATFTVTLSSATGEAVTFNYASADQTDGTLDATAGADYTAVSGNGTIAAGETTTTITVPITDDFIKDNNEQFNINLTTLSSNVATSGNDTLGVGTITDGSSETGDGDDAEDTVYAVISAPVDTTEGDTTANFIVELLDKDGNAVTVTNATTVEVVFANGTAENGDYTATTQTVTVAVGSSTATLTVDTAEDVDFDNETFIATINSVQDTSEFENIDYTSGVDGKTPTATATIIDDDAKPTISIDDITVNEDAGTATFTVTLSSATGEVVTFNYASADQSDGTLDATAGADYTVVSGNGTIAVGDITTTITVPITDDFIKDNNEQFNINLTNLSSNVATTGNDTLGVGTITDGSSETGGGDDAEDTVYAVISAPVDTTEGDTTANFIVELLDKDGNAVTVTNATTVEVVFANGTAENGDYRATTQTVTVAVGSSTATLTVDTAEDVDFDNETFTATINSVQDNNEFENIDYTSGVGVKTPTATATIIDDDTPPTISINDITVNEDAGTATFTVTLSSATGEVVTFNYASADQSDGTLDATAGADYTAVSGNGTIAVGDTTTTITVPITDDFIKDNNEQFNINLTTLSSNVATTGNDTLGVGTITDGSSETGGEDTVILKLIALDKDDDPILDNDGNYVTANSVIEGSYHTVSGNDTPITANYKVLAFAPETTVFKASNLASEQLGTVDISFANGTVTDKIAIGGNSGTSSTDGTEDYVNTTQTTVAVGSVISTDIINDIVADKGEQFTVNIVTGTYLNTAGTKYEAVSINTDGVTTTIDDFDQETITLDEKGLRENDLDPTKTTSSGTLGTDIANVELVVPTESFTSGKKPITWTLSVDKKTLTGTIPDGEGGTKEVLKTVIDDAGVYTTTLSNPIDQTNPSGEDDFSTQSAIIPIVVKATTTKGEVVETTLNVDIKDDTPEALAGDNVLTLYIEPVTTNLSFIVDISSSMTNYDLETTENVIRETIETYEKLGDVNVNIVQFYGNNKHESGWIKSINEITGNFTWLGDSSDSTGGEMDTGNNATWNNTAIDRFLDNSKSGTDIEQGLRALVDSYSNYQPEASQDIVYFFGDGDTYNSNTVNYQDDFDNYTGVLTTRDNTAIDSDNSNITAIDNVNYTNTWSNFVINSIDKLYTYSVNTSNVLIDIAHVADNNENKISAEAKAVDVTSLKNEIISQVEVSKDGSFNENSNGTRLINFGADGGHLESVTIVTGKTMYYDEHNVEKLVEGVNGNFLVNFETGTYTYTVTVDDRQNHVEKIKAVIVDNDGDKVDTLLLDVNIIYSEALLSEVPQINETDTTVLSGLEQVVGNISDNIGISSSTISSTYDTSVRIDATTGDIYYTSDGTHTNDKIVVTATDASGNVSSRNISVSVISAEDNADTPNLTMSISDMITTEISLDDFSDGENHDWTGSFVNTTLKTKNSDDSITTTHLDVMKLGVSIWGYSPADDIIATKTWTGLSANLDVNISFITDIEANTSTITTTEGNGWDNVNAPYVNDRMDIFINKVIDSNNYETENVDYSRGLIADLDNNVLHSFNAKVDASGNLRVAIVNNHDTSINEWLSIDNFKVEYYSYDITLAASIATTGDNETLSNITLSDLPDGATLKYNNGELVEKVDGEYSVDVTKLNNNNNIIKVFTVTAMTEAESDAITSSVTATEANGDVATVERKMEDAGDATIVDGIIEGLYYETTSGFKGYTDANGEFDYYDGDKVIFKLGDLVVGSMMMSDTDDDKVFLQDLAQVDRTDMNDEYVENMAVLLQSLDSSDGDNIVITQEIRDAFKDSDIDLATISEEELVRVIEEVGRVAISEDEAMEHVAEMLEEYDGVEEGTLEERVEDEAEETSEVTALASPKEDVEAEEGEAEASHPIEEEAEETSEVTALASPEEDIEEEEGEAEASHPIEEEAEASHPIEEETEDTSEVTALASPEEDDAEEEGEAEASHPIEEETEDEPLSFDEEEDFDFDNIKEDSNNEPTNDGSVEMDDILEPEEEISMPETDEPKAEDPSQDSSSDSSPEPEYSSDDATVAVVVNDDSAVAVI